jgi:FemAB-related protein (PEP-CTERM system-associated)
MRDGSAAQSSASTFSGSPAAVPALRLGWAGAADQPEWDGYVQAHPRAELYHDYRWRSLIESVFGHEAHYLMALDSTGVRGILPLVRLKSRLFGDFLVSQPYLNYGGVVADTAEVRTALLEAAADHARSLGIQHMELRHRDEPCLDWAERTDKVAMLLDLPQSEEELWRRFPAKLKSQIRRPEKDGATVRQGGRELLADFYSVFSRNMRDLGTPVYPQKFFAAIAEAFPAALKVFVVDLAGKPVAAGLVLAHRDTLEIPWASSLRQANKSGVNMLLYWSVLREAVARGLKRFDFGRSTKDSGTYRFKQQWGAKPTQLRWHYWLASGRSMPSLTPNNPKYRTAIALWRRLPLPIANFVGPRIVKNLP